MGGDVRARLAVVRRAGRTHQQLLRLCLARARATATASDSDRFGSADVPARWPPGTATAAAATAIATAPAPSDAVSTRGASSDTTDTDTFVCSSMREHARAVASPRNPGLATAGAALAAGPRSADEVPALLSKAAGASLQDGRHVRRRYGGACARGNDGVWKRL